MGKSLPSTPAYDTSFLAPGWRERIGYLFQMPEIINLFASLKKTTYYPHKSKIFKAFTIGDFHQVNVVIMGQDPYYSAGVATGLAFGVDNESLDKPPTMANILAEVERNVGEPIDHSQTSLIGWAEQGVLLLNKYLTVAPGLPLSHDSIGWEFFTGNVMHVLSQEDRPMVFMLWGSAAREYKDVITNPKHLVLEATHPSPQSASSGSLEFRFRRSFHFIKANEFLEKNGIRPIDWKRMG